MYLRKWVKAAGIRKKITWHCARHSFAVNVLTKGANIKTVSSLLGHTSIKMTERYLHVVDSLKQDAINSLGEINYTPM
ncbi:tyrosine-type recombinase/integrase [uncultured Duncaniella sp.]|uniref:tyrosine-type recombinase/integrase n=1 Tax=uncultured Duncaniella sp. TaxID=2768039 RepID=UPI003510021A